MDLLRYVQVVYDQYLWEVDLMPPTAPPAKPVEVVKPARKSRKPVDPNETPEARFKRLAMQRVPAAVKRLTHVANLFRGSSYTSTQEQRDKCLSAIKAAYDEVVRAATGVKATQNGFTL